MKKLLSTFISGLSSKEKMMLYCACAAVGIAVFDRLVLGPITKESANIEEKIKNQMVTVEKDLTILQYKDKIINEDKTYSVFYTKNGLSAEELIGTFLSEVEGLAKSSGIALNNINPVTTEEKKDYTEYSLIIECTGNMKNILDFIYGVDNSKKPIMVASFEIVPKNREAYDVKCTIEIVKVVLIPKEIESEA